jgi:hypothetical protein
MDAPKGITPETIDKIKGMLNPQPTEEPTEETQQPEAESQPEDNNEPEAEAQPEVRTFKVKVDGEEIEVPEDEVLKGYSRTSDYTRKTQKLAEERKALEAESQRVKAEREQYAQGLQALKSQLATAQEPDWAKLADEDPIEFVKQKELHRDRKEKLALVEQEQRKVADLQTYEQQRALQTYIQDEQVKLTQAIPEWKDAKTAQTEKEKIASFALSLGYSEADIAQIYDHRAVVALRKAALYDEVMSKAKSQVEKAKDGPKTARPGNLQPVPNKQYLAQKEQFKSTGSLKDAAGLAKLLLRK